MRPDTSFSGPELCTLSATEAVGLLRRGEVSATELVEASLTRIAQVEPSVNATVTVCADRAREAARKTAGTDLGGLPIGIKDLTPVAGVLTTMGTKALKRNYPLASDPLVLRLEERGAIVMGKTNTPEMGAGGNTFNAVFGMTRNPWDTARNAGGSSGGAAVSLATGEVWLSHGSDLAGSLRTPASFCGVVGFRPSPGVAGGGSAAMGFANEGLQGPMARNVADCALFLDAMAGYDPVWPLSMPAPATPYAQAAAQHPGPIRIAFAPDLGGFAPVEPVIAQVLSDAMTQAQGPDCTVEDACPALPDLEKTYRALRAFYWAALPGRAPDFVQEFYKPTLAQNIAEGRALCAEDIVNAQLSRSALYDRMRRFLADFDVLACPVTGIGPGPVEEEFPRSVAGVPTGDYIDWLRFSFLATTTTLPSMSLPAGFTPDGLPVGLQLIGRPRGEARLLQVAQHIETALALPTTPIDPITRSSPAGR
ncbi:amidase [Primorskyibacter marinus]|uniref:amidase n=1 Tax=Primorskyibacter marinus TaxID=1977320 RepID=UPI000E305B2F|nr:amidase [Primorskyibacter marinus]